MLCTSWGLSVRGIAYDVQYFAPKVPWYVPVVLSQTGWVSMVSGFALVLWSRLGLIIQSQKTKRHLLWMIIFNGLVFHITMTILSLGVWGLKQHPARNKASIKDWVKVQAVFERIQILCFCGQEILISSLYIKAAYQYLRTWGALAPESARERIRRAMMFLLIVQTVVVLIDVAIITIDFLGLIKLKGFLHSFIYCVKLEFEFVVLNQLVEISTLNVPGLPSTLSQSTSGGAQSSSQAPTYRWSDATLQLSRSGAADPWGDKSACVHCSSVVPLTVQTKQLGPQSAFEGLPGFADIDEIESQ
jgi:hypothetical protein